MKRIYLLVLCLLGLTLACLKPAGVRYEGLPKQEDGALHVIAFDVGQADAMLVMHKGKAMLIDAGTSRAEPHKVEQRLPRRLDALRGSRHLDYFMVSHYHKDHFGWPGGTKASRSPTGLFALVEREGLTIGTVLDRGDFTIQPYKSAGLRHYERALSAWLSAGAVQKRRVLRPGDTVDMGEGLRVDVVTASGNGHIDKLRALFPTLVTDYPPTENDYSLGIKLTLGDFEMFTAGDLSGRNALRQYGTHRESYNDMESRIAHEVGPVEVYRVNHHGSRHSSNECFVDVLAPMVSVVSSGKNSYGHPDPHVYEMLKKKGDVRITGGADIDSLPFVGHDIVGDDVEIVVSPDGKRFWVNGAPYEAKSDKDELARPGQKTACIDTLGQSHVAPPSEAPTIDNDVAD